MKTLFMAWTLLTATTLYASTNISMRTISKVMEAKILTNAAGMTLYTFDEDELGQSNCDESCLRVWPAHKVEDADSVESPFSTIAALDGGFHILLDGKPLYTFISDKDPGDIKGDNLGGVWHIVKLSELN